MSDGHRRPVREVLPIAEKLVERMEPYCHRIAIAGSLRRYKDRHGQRVGDIEIVAIPRVEVREQPGLFDKGERVAATNHLHNYLDGLLGLNYIRHSDPQRWGSKHRSFILSTVKGGFYKVDLFMCLFENWGNTLLIRTGSSEFSKWMMTKREEGGAMPATHFHDKNRLWYQDDKMDAPLALDLYEEDQFFLELGLPPVPPEHRHDKKWHRFLEEQKERA